MTEDERKHQEELEAVMAYVGETDEGWEDFTDWAFARGPLAWKAARATQTGPELRSQQTFIELGRALCRTVETDMWQYVEENFHELRKKAQLKGFVARLEGEPE